MSRRACALVLVVFLSACQTTSSERLSGGRPAKLTVISFPAGAVIEVDGDYKGRTPNVIELMQYKRSHVTAPFYSLSVHPMEDDYCTRKAILDPYDIPEKVFLDLTQCQEALRTF